MHYSLSTGNTLISQVLLGKASQSSHIARDAHSPQPVHTPLGQPNNAGEAVGDPIVRTSSGREHVRSCQWCFEGVNDEFTHNRRYLREFTYKLDGQKCTDKVAKRASVVSPSNSRCHLLLLSAFKIRARLGILGNLTGPEN